MPAIPPVLLKKLYVKGSLRAEGSAFALELQNTIAPATILGLQALELDGVPVPLQQVEIVEAGGEPRAARDVAANAALSFPLGETLTLRVAGLTLQPGEHCLRVRVVVRDVGALDIPVVDQVVSA